MKTYTYTYTVTVTIPDYGDEDENDFERIADGAYWADNIARVLDEDDLTPSATAQFKVVQHATV